MRAFIFILKHTKQHLFFFLLTSDRGLCGGFNLNITREFRKHAKNLSDYHYGVLGQKGKDILLRFPEASFELQDLSSSLKEIASLKDVQNLVQILLSYRSQDVIGDVYVIRSRFRNIMASQVVIEPLLPFSVKQEENTKKNYGFMEPSSAEAIKKFLAYTLSVRLWTYVCESHTCEQAARMMAMDQANRNAKDLIQRLELRYNRTRQSQITRELIEVMSAAESLSSRS
jgi:F-type H+-transporting ATPase subunit gamma